MKECFAGKSAQEIALILSEIGQPSFRTKQIVNGIAQGKPFSEMTDLPKSLREKLQENYLALGAEIFEVRTSKDGTEKYLFRLADGNIVEGVLMKYKYGNTLCVSTQVGCRMNCAFCASGIGGLVRNLTAGEMLSFVLVANRRAGGTPEKRAITNLVLMGSGEPLDNYEEVVRFLRLAASPDMLGISPRNVSLSTCGLVPNMRRLAEEGLPVNLTVSLHEPFDEERKQIMPIANAYSIAEILDACHYYFQKTGRRYIFEYSLIRGKNDTPRHAEELIRLLKGKPCHVNLIRLNPVEEKKLLSPTEKEAYRFMGLLEKGGLSATLRRQIGVDIDGACGQLRRKFIGEDGGLSKVK